MRKFLFILFAVILFSCKKEIQTSDRLVEEIETAAAKGKPIKCFTVCDVTESPDLTVVTNAEEDTLYPDGYIDRTSYFWTRYGVRSEPVRWNNNYLTTGRDAIRYGWDSLVYINRIRLQCLLENIAPYGCGRGWVFSESQGYVSPLGNIYFNGLFTMKTYEKGGGNNWKLLYTDFKKEFFPSAIPTQEHVYDTYPCYYYGYRALPSQTGDFYYNYFRLPLYDGVFRIVIEFNPIVGNCRAVKETNYNNNKAYVEVTVIEGLPYVTGWH